MFKNDYGFPIITESTVANATTNNGRQLIEIEQKLKSNPNFNTTILRFSGLFGNDRHPANNLSKRKNISNPEAPINLIHRKDCIQIINTILKKEFWNLELNASYPKHPDKKTYYSNYCKSKELPLPKFNSLEKSKGKIIDSTKLVQLLNYSFKHMP